MAVSLTHSSPIYCPTFDILAATEVELLDLEHPVEDLEATYDHVRAVLRVGCKLVAVPLSMFLPWSQSASVLRVCTCVPVDVEVRTRYCETDVFLRQVNDCDGLKATSYIRPRIVDLNPGWQSYLTAAAQIQFCIALEKLHELFRRQNP